METKETRKAVMKDEGKQALVIEHAPDKARYAPGAQIDYAGLKATWLGEDVTDALEFSVAPGTAWRAADKKLVVEAAYPAGDGQRHVAAFTLKRKVPIAQIALALALVAAVAAVAAVVAYNSMQPQGDAGSYIIPQGDMTDDEAQAMLDDMAEKSRITVSLRPTEELRDDGALHVNFVVVEDNNGFSERLEIEQDGEVVYKSGIVSPGRLIEWGQSRGAHAGPATATVYAVDGDGRDSGNPVSVEIEIVGAQ